MNAQRLSCIAVTLVLSLSGLVQAQGPWPTLNTPSFFSPVNEFFTPRPYSTQYQPYAPSYNGTQIIPGVPQCANGRCSIPTSTNYTPALGQGSCPNGQCGPGNSYSTNYAPNCANGQCRPSNGGVNSSLFQPGYSSQIGLRPLTPSYQVPASYRGAVNRLTPVDGFSAPATPIYRSRESQLPSGPDYTYDPSIKLR